MHLTDEKDIVKLEKTSFTHTQERARIFFNKTARRQCFTTTGCFVVKTMLYWHAIFTNRGKTSELTRVWLLRQRWKLLYFYDLLLKRTIDFFLSRIGSNNNSDYLHFPALFFVALCLSHLSSAELQSSSIVKSIEIRQMFKNIVAKIGRRENPHFHTQNNHIKINTTVKSGE